jgi:hypothetical protein
MSDTNTPLPAAHTSKQVKSRRRRSETGQHFTSSEVASLIRHHEEVSELVGALIEAISNMLPVDPDGEPELPGASRLLAHCEELLGDASFFMAYKSRIHLVQEAGA